MLGGYNTNVRHRGVVFHVQTEDSGHANPHLTTHLYHGGTILASDRSDYAEDLESPDLPRLLRARVEAQHKAMVSRLQNGELDQQIGERLGPGVFGSPAEAPVPPSATDRPAFGDGILSENSLDEVVLSFLGEHARKRKRRTE